MHLQFYYYNLKQHMKQLFTLVAIICIACTTTQAQKIGIVSPDEVFALMPETRKADTTLALYQNAMAENYQGMQEELNSAYQKFVKDSLKMTVPQREVKRGELNKKFGELQNKEQEINKELEAKKDELLKPIRERMLKAIQEVAKENAYAYVMYREQVIVFPEAEDLTDKVKTKLGIKKK